jgi:hypothetical protein
MRENPREDERETKNPEPGTNEIELESSGEVTVVPQKEFQKRSEPRKIHPRRPLPAVPEEPE